MVFSLEDKAVIKNDFDEFNMNAYQIWKRHSAKNWDYSSVKRLVNRYKETDTMDRKKGSGRPISVTTAENHELVDELICSQEDQPHSHQAPRKIEETTGIARTSVRRMAASNGVTPYKRLKIPQMNSATRKRRFERARDLAERYEKKSRMIEKTVWQDEKVFYCTSQSMHRKTGFIIKARRVMYPTRIYSRKQENTRRNRRKSWYLQGDSQSNQAVRSEVACS